MRHDDWFLTLDFAHQALLREDEATRQELLAALTALEKDLGGSASPRAYSKLPGQYGFYRAARLQPDERQWAERLAERLWKATGTGRTSVEELVLGLIGVQASPDSLPFFRAALEASRERDSFQTRRRRIAVASVAFIAQRTGDAAAQAQLEAWLTHPDVTVRTEAVALYGRLHLREEGELEATAVAALTRVAYEDRAFAPRFLARGVLHAAGIPVRVELPDGIYTFKASLRGTSCTVELTTAQSLSDLAAAILDAFGWDHDHLYEFALTGDIHDRRFVLPDEDYEPLGFGWDSGADVEPEALGTAGPEVSDEVSPMALPLGSFRFSKGHKFIFRYDFGDNHRFQVTVTDVHAHRNPRAKYPRVVARTGKTLEQYPRYD